MSQPGNGSFPEKGAVGFVPRRITGPVLLGVVPDQPREVLQRGAELAHNLGVKLICAYVDITTYLTDEPDEWAQSAATGAAGLDDDAEGVSTRIRESLQTILDGSGVRWSFLTLTGNPTRALAQLAESAAASHIVVGTREPDLGSRLEHLLVGSVAVQLTRRQHRPVLVVPVTGHTPPVGR
jgi:nucleotide-binding universal stress UspA family protein